jgi:hypothetical protein
MRRRIGRPCARVNSWERARRLEIKEIQTRRAAPEGLLIYVRLWGVKTLFHRKAPAHIEANNALASNRQ